MLRNQELDNRRVVHRKTIWVEFGVNERRDAARNQSKAGQRACKSHVKCCCRSLLVRVDEFMVADDLQKSGLRCPMKLLAVLVISDRKPLFAQFRAFVE